MYLLIVNTVGHNAAPVSNGNQINAFKNTYNEKYVDILAKVSANASNISLVPSLNDPQLENNVPASTGISNTITTKQS